MKGKGVIVKTKSGEQIELDLYMRVVAMTSEEAVLFVGGGATSPVDLGPASSSRFKDGARVWGFPSRAETAEEKADRVWTVAHGGTVET